MRKVLVRIDHELAIWVTDLSKTEHRRLVAAFTYPNPTFFKLQKMGRWVGNTPRTIDNYRELEGRSGLVVRFPRGAARKLDLEAQKLGIDLDFQDERLTLDDFEFLVRPSAKTVTLRADQEATIDAILTRENGLVRAATGSGKTEIVIEAIRRARQPALVVVWSKALLDQWVERISARWGWHESEIGVIGDGRFRVGPITVAMHQSLAPRVDALRGSFGFLACDEVHRWAARTFREVAGLFPARYRIGVSADERRKDGLEDLTHDIFGPVAYELNRKDLIRDGRIAEVKIVAVPTGFQLGGELAAKLASVPEGERGSLLSQNYVKVLDQLTTDQHRNDTIGRLASQEASEGRSVLVFTDRVEHAFEIARVVSTRYGVPCGTLVGGAGNRTAFVETAARLHEGTLRVAVGTSCVYEGFDVPRLEVGIVATPSATNRQRLEQQIGRLRRLHPGKTTGLLYYVWDEQLFPTHLRRIRSYYGANLVRELGQ